MLAIKQGCFGKYVCNQLLILGILIYMQMTKVIDILNQKEYMESSSIAKSREREQEKLQMKLLKKFKFS